MDKRLAKLSVTGISPDSSTLPVEFTMMLVASGEIMNSMYMELWMESTPCFASVRDSASVCVCVHVCVCELEGEPGAWASPLYEVVHSARDSLPFIPYFHLKSAVAPKIKRKVCLG